MKNISLQRIRQLVAVILLTLLSVNQSYSNPYKQIEKITLNGRNQSVRTIFEELNKQSGIVFFYDESVLDKAKPVTLDVRNEHLDKVLNQISQQTNLVFKRIDNTVSVRLSEEQSVSRQSGTITGTVRDESGQSMPGVNVVEKGTTNGVITDSEGRFSIKLTGPDPLLVFSFIGYTTQEHAAGNRTILDVQMKEETQQIDEIVVVGYGSQSKVKTTGSIARLKAVDFVNMPISSVEQGMAGQMPGVQVMQSSGTPGSGISVRIRGLASISAGNQPLYVIDGFPVSDPNTSMINPNDIESTDVLKDAASASIYGSRGGNGVVMITTKKGNTDKPRIAFDAYYGIQQVTKKIPMMNAYQYAELVKSSRNNSWVERKAGNSPDDPNSARPINMQIPDFLQPYLNGQQGLTDTDWQDEIFRTAPIQNYSLGVAGGKEGVRYYVSANFMDQEGVIINTGFKRYAFRANLEGKLSRNVTIGMNLAPSFSISNAVAEGGHGSDGIVTTALIAMPNFPVYNDDGSFALGNQGREAIKYSMAVLENPVALARMIEDKTNKFRILGGTYVDIQIVNGLKFKTYFGVDYYSADRQYFRPSELGIYRVPPPSQATGKSETGNYLNWISENTLSYSKEFGKNNFTALAGYTMQKETRKANSISATGYPNDQIHTISAATKITDATSTIEQWSLISYLARVTYDYDYKYLFSASIRSDGSSRFGSNNRWGWFPSASAGWRISQEDFFPENSFVNELKLRLSYGQTGNFQIPNYGSFSLLANTNYIFNGTLVNGQSPDTAPNPELSWEKTAQSNAGIEIGLWDSKLYLTADYYTSTTNDLLLNVPVPYSSGYTTMLRNVGKVKNQGFEFGITSKLNLGPVLWSATLNLSTNKNKVLELGPDQDEIITTRNITRIGHPIGSFYGYNVIGVFQDNDDVKSYPHLASAKPGSYKYENIVDEDPNKKEITSADRKILGNPFPKYTAGFTSNFMYKGFDFSFVIQAVQDFQIANVNRSIYWINGEGWGNAAEEEYYGRYISPSQPGSGLAMNRVTPTDNNHQNSSCMIEDGSFIRFRNITLGYTLPQQLTRKIKVDRARVYCSAQNPFIITSYSGFNPEVSNNGSNALAPGLDYGTYPTARTFVFGLNLNF